MVQVMDGDGMVRSYTQISQEEAKKMMEVDDGHIMIIPAWQSHAIR